MCKHIEKLSKMALINGPLLPIVKYSGWLAMAMLSQLSEEFPVQRPTVGEYFTLYGAKYVKIIKKITKKMTN